MRIIVVIVLLLSGCKGGLLLPALTPYKMDIQQGNVVTQDMVQKLQPGMSRAQVRFLLGTPLIVDAFRADRWDYVFLYKKGDQPVEQRRLIVLFKDDKLVRVEGDQMPPGPGASTAAGRDAKPAAASAPATGPATTPGAPSDADRVEAVKQ